MAKPEPSRGERVPPQDTEMEKSVLGAMLLEKEAISKVLEIFNESSFFYKDTHRKIFDAIIALFDRNDPIDIVTLREELHKRRQLEEVGGEYYLSTLVSDVSSPANVTAYAKIVLEKALFRKLITVATEVIQESYEATEDAIDVVDRAEQKIFSLAERRLQKGFIHIEPLLKNTFELIEKAHEHKGGYLGVPSGFKKLDELTAGFQQSDLIIIAGRPSMGKTAFALNIARNAAVDHKIPVGIFSLEMSDFQLTHRMLCSEARLNAHSVRTGKLEDTEWQNLSINVGALSEAPIFVDDTPSMSVLDVRAKSRRLKVEHDIKLIIIDYLQLMHSHTRVENRQQEISTISRSLKALAKELNIPVIALSQLSRAVEQRGENKIPQLSDLRESGAIEQDADVVLFIYREEMYKKQEEIDANIRGKAEIIIGKQRNGPSGSSVHLNFIKDYSRFSDPPPGEYDMGEYVD